MGLGGAELGKVCENELSPELVEQLDVCGGRRPGREFLWSVGCLLFFFPPLRLQMKGFKPEP